ncbi:hypothetical protein [Paenibacillus hexagrammi]|uniref:Uncharacterized protein n=1 Tax=Paenibacillus hexagrammi TaxID=2908839 RepID=A0ABY3SG61_9BACL|nr:hypothetical protein [Paenibacillus sp. YPD9-1]UJF32443.1 hypothetical protein L0M14_22625 [Paenibacillus sp. YPD9-1]
MEFKDGDNLVRIWLEDEISVQSRVGLAHKYDLAGIASWRRGFETKEMWNTIDETLHNESADMKKAGP